MPLLGLREAAEMVGKNESTIHRAMKSGRLSFTVGPNGERQLDPAELERAFPPKAAKALRRNGAQDDMLRSERDVALATVARLEQHIRSLEDDKTDLRQERDRLLTLAESATRQLADLRTKQESEPRRRWFGFGKR
jgi:hypothetical protein